MVFKIFFYKNVKGNKLPYLQNYHWINVSFSSYGKSSRIKNILHTKRLSCQMSTFVFLRTSSPQDLTEYEYITQNGVGVCVCMYGTGAKCKVEFEDEDCGCPEIVAQLHLFD